MTHADHTTKRTMQTPIDGMHHGDGLTLNDYKAFFETLGSHVIASATNAAGDIIYVNDKFVEASKYSKDELLGQNHRILKSGAHEPEFYNNLWKTISSGKVWRGELRNRAKDGTYYWVDTSIAPILGADKKPEKYVSVRFLITERKEIEEELRERKENSEFLADATVLLASSLEYETVLRHLAELIVPRFADWCAIDLAVDSPGVLKKVAVKHSDPLMLALANRLQEQYQPVKNAPHGPYKVFTTGQSEFFPEISKNFFKETGYGTREYHDLLDKLGFRSLMRVPIKHRGAINGVITFASGRNRRKYAVNALELAEELGKRAGVALENARLYRELQDADQRKDDFIATLAHELRNPLAPLLLRAQLLEMHTEKFGRTDPMLGETADVVARQTKTMARLLDDLLDISRLMRGKISLKKEYIDIATVVRRSVETTRPLYEQKGVELVLPRHLPSLYLYADPIRVEQIIVNLLNNAAKYNHTGGRVWVTINAHGQDIAIHIKDTGVGIRNEMFPKLFTIFAQDDERRTLGGLGIGLALAKNLAEMHGGSLHAKSEGTGKGATFTLKLPMAIARRGGSGGTAVLIVDDNRDAAEALAECLKYSGYVNVRTAANGEEAIAALNTFLPNYVFLDIRMPGMDGYATLQAMRKDARLRETTFAAVTGYGQEEDRKKTTDAGFDYHFTKPVEVHILLQLLSKKPVVHA